MVDLNGEPRVTEDGHIVYIFPELQQTTETIGDWFSSRFSNRGDSEEHILQDVGLPSDASTHRIQLFLQSRGVSTQGSLDRADLIRLLENIGKFSGDGDIVPANMLQEQEYEFSVAPHQKRTLAACMGALNLGGVIYLGGLLNQCTRHGMRLPSYMGLLQHGYPLLLSYAILFNVIPLVRSWLISKRNERLRARNFMRDKWQALLASADLNDSLLGRKLRAAKYMGTKVRQLTEADVVFDTRNGIEEITGDRNKDEMNSFDVRLKKCSGGDV